VHIVPWSSSDLDLLRQLNSHDMTSHLGGPETEEQLLARHNRYTDAGEPGAGGMFRIVLLPKGLSVGSIGYWERTWQNEQVYECGWCVLPEFQGRGIAAAATLPVIERARAEQWHAYLHAFPSVDHPASNRICRKAGFTWVSECDFEYPAGRFMRCNNWRRDLVDNTPGRRGSLA